MAKITTKTKVAYKKPTSLASLRESMTKMYGEGRVTKRENVKPYEIIPTGSLSLDQALRVGGWVRGRLHEIAGVEGVGKTTLVIASMVQAQNKYPNQAVGYIDMEQTFDWDWAESLGLDTSDEKFLHVYPDNSEDVSDQLSDMAKTGLFSMIAVDSIGGMESKKAFDKTAEEAVMGNNAQVITRMVKKTAAVANRENVAILLINQFRANLSNPAGGDVSAGPKALKYATSVKVDMRRTGEPPLTVGSGDNAEKVGSQVSARVVRSKVAAQGRVARFWILNQPTDQYGPIGIDVADEAYTVGVRSGVIKQGGAWFTLPNGEKFQGGSATKDYLRDNPEVMYEIRDQAVAAVAGDVIPNVETDFEEDVDA